MFDDERKTSHYGAWIALSVAGLCALGWLASVGLGEMSEVGRTGLFVAIVVLSRLGLIAGGSIVDRWILKRAPGPLALPKLSWREQLGLLAALLGVLALLAGLVALFASGHPGLALSLFVALLVGAIAFVVLRLRNALQVDARLEPLDAAELGGKARVRVVISPSKPIELLGGALLLVTRTLHDSGLPGEFLHTPGVDSGNPIEVLLGGGEVRWDPEGLPVQGNCTWTTLESVPLAGGALPAGPSTRELELPIPRLAALDGDDGNRRRDTFCALVANVKGYGQLRQRVALPLVAPAMRAG